MAKFVTIGERLSTTAPAVNKAFTERDPEPIIKRAKQQLDAGATYLDVNIGPAENDGEDLMKWAVQLLQSEFDNVPLALDTTNQKAIEAGISVYNRAKGKPIVNSLQTQVTEFPISTLQQQMMQSVSHFAPLVW